MTFEQAVKQGDLHVARAILDELVELPDTGLLMTECYADLAREYDRQGRHDDAIALHERAIELGWDSIPDPRSDIAEFHLRARREEQATAIWAKLKAFDPDDVWLYNAAGLSYNEVGEHELAIAWLGEVSSLRCGSTSTRKSSASFPMPVAIASARSVATSTSSSGESIRSWKHGDRRSKRAGAGSTE